MHMYIGKNTLNWQVTWFEIPEIRQIVTAQFIKKRDGQLSQNCDRYYKLRWFLQIARDQIILSLYS